MGRPAVRGEAVRGKAVRRQRTHLSQGQATRVGHPARGMMTPPLFIITMIKMKVRSGTATYPPQAAFVREAGDRRLAPRPGCRETCPEPVSGGPIRSFASENILDERFGLLSPVEIGISEHKPPFRTKPPFKEGVGDENRCFRTTSDGDISPYLWQRTRLNERI